MSDRAVGLKDMVTVEDKGSIRIVRMNRPEKLNALNTRLTFSLLHALEAADCDDSVRAVVLAGAGRAFCAGADLSEFSTLTRENQSLVLRRAELTCRTLSILQILSKPIVSAVQGSAVGGGAGLAIGCDMMIAGADLKFGYPELTHSIVPALVMTGLQRQLGRKAAFEMISLGRLLGAEEALALGLANRIAQPTEVLEVALEIAGQWTKTNPLAMSAAKSLFYRVGDLSFEAAMAAGRDVNAIMRTFREALP